MSRLGRWLQLRSLLSLTLSFTLAVPADLLAQTWTAPTEEQIAEINQHLDPTEQEALKNIIEQVETLQTAFGNPEGPSHALDDFDLIQQEVVDQRQADIDGKIKSIVDQDFAIKRKEEVSFLLAEALKNPSRTIEFIGAEKVQVAADTLGLHPKKDLSTIIEAALNNDEVSNLLDIKPDKVEHFVDEELPPRRLYRMNLKVNVMKKVGDNELLVGSINQKDAVGSTAASFSEKTFFQSPQDGAYRFDIATSQGEVIHRFNRPVSAVGFYGRFLVYMDKKTSDPGQKLPLRFIDLDYFKGAIGNTPLAAFEFPTEFTELHNISVQSGQLSINDKEIPYSVFKVAADIYQAYFNIKVALIDPKTASSASNLIKELVYYKDQALKQMDATETQMLNSALDGMQGLDTLVSDMELKLEAQNKSGPSGNADKVPEKLRKALAENPDFKLTFEPTINVIESQVLSASRLSQVNRSIMVSRQFFSRLHLLMAKLNQPQPMGSPKIIQGMIMLAESALKKDWKKAKENWSDLKQHPVVSYGRFGAPALAAAALGATISDTFAFTIYETLQMGKDSVLGYLQHINYGKNFVDLMGYAADKAAEGPINGVPGYFTAENLPKLGVLASAMAGLVFSIYGTLHLTANTMTALRYFSRHKNWINKARSEGKSRLGAYGAAFVKYQNALKLYYDKGLAQAEAQSNKGSQTKFNASEDQIADEIMTEIKKKPGIFYRISKALKGSKKAVETLTKDLQDAGDRSEEFTDSLKGHTHLNQISTLRAALSQFALSYPSTVITSRFNGTLWNYWFMIRSFALKPKSWPLFLTYPELFRIGIDGQEDRLHMPSKLNGGYRTDLDSIKFVFGNLDTDATLKDLKIFEKSVLPVEALAYEVALEKALETLIREVKDPKQLKQFFDSGAVPKANLPPSAIMKGSSPTTGIRSISDPKINKLSKRNQTFFRSVFNRLYEKTTEAYLKEYLKDFNPDVANTKTTAELKNLGVNLTEQMNSLNTSLQGKERSKVQQRMKALALDLLQDGKIVEDSRQVANSFTKIGERMLVNVEHDVIQNLDPNKPQISRFKTAERQLGNLKSVIRAVNALASEIVIDKGMGLLTILVMYAAVSEGMLAPLQNEMFGPDSWFYGSRYLFLNGFVTGVIMSAMASVWMKVQMDDRIDSSGGFDKVPTTADRDRSYLRYYVKSFFKNPANKWSSNQLHAMKLAWANLSAAFVTIAAANFLTMGRFDLGAFMTGYLIVFLTPLSGIDYKIDQTHELASRWQASKVMRKLRAHPKMQEWINKSVLLKRYPHNVFAGVYGFFMGPFVSLYELMDTPTYGKRSFLNLLLNGYQPEEIVSAGLQTVNKYLGWIPGVEHVTATCEALLTNNNTALDPSKLINPPGGTGN
ncbi:MAG: hypothetical protein GW917_00660 [Bdellovibrionales bacterium]|nr:hypothetical protein [Bdellovibrionales bacterium]